MILAWKGSVAAEAVPAAATIIVVGGDAVVGRALELLLRGSGFDARSEPLTTFDVNGAPLDAELILLAPGLGELDRSTVLTSVDADHRGNNLPVVELVPATKAWPREGHAFLSWPCRTQDLEREVEAALHRKRSMSGGCDPSQEEGASRMITVTVRVGKEETGPTEPISAPSIREAVAIAQARHPGEEVRVAYPIDGEAFFLRPPLREAAGHL